MGLTERIEYINSNAIEMIASMARVSFREHYVDLYTNQHNTTQISSLSIQNWISGHKKYTEVFQKTSANCSISSSIAKPLSEHP
ncbi:MAG TPA: hypothetical protein DCE14_08115 [Kosmotogaceae bacterium]|nr:hypothetical protein [Kosmotogaceae bacterium]